MARALKTIASRMVLAVVIIHAVLLPLLSYGLFTIIRDSQQEAFVDHARIYTRVFADIFETSVATDSDEELILHLDSAILGSKSIFAMLEIGDKVLSSTMMQPEDANRFVEDFAFGEHDDDIYYLSVPLQMKDQVAVLKRGFDEGPTVALIENAWQTLVDFVLIYLLVSLVLAVLFSALLAKPLQRLRRDSRKIASGDYELHLSVASRIYEIQELTRDLEEMRSNLVGFNARLQQEIRERQAAEAENRRIESQLNHEQRLQSIGTLAGGIAHEFNNVLLPMILYLELALEDLPDANTARDNLERVLKLANRARGLSQKILTFGRQSGDAAKIAVDIGPVVEEAMSMVRALIPASVEIRLSIAENTGTLFCDATEIQQLVVNLCSNAFHALTTAGGRIAVDVSKVTVTKDFAERHSRLRPGKYVRLQVADTGKGMEQAIMDRIFEPFFTTREVGSGTGLGLSVVHGIVVKHEGEIVVSSAPNRGTTIDVYFPLVGGQLIATAMEVTK